MKRSFLAALTFTVVFWLTFGQAVAQQVKNGPEQKDAKTELQALVGKIRDQLKTGKNSEADLAPYLKEFDALLERHKAEKTDEVANILRIKASLYLEVLNNTDKGLELLKQLKTDFPDTQMGKSADSMIAAIIAKQANQKRLAVGAAFPDFNVKDLEGKPLSVADFKGKVVLVDFWATWCGPCVGELPNVLKTYEKYHAKGFEIIGVSLDKEKETLTRFIKDKGITWPQYFDGKGWQNLLAEQYGIESIPATFLLDGEGKILARDLRGEQLAAEVGKRLQKR
jgi:peroxiredoxin